MSIITGGVISQPAVDTTVKLCDHNVSNMEMLADFQLAFLALWRHSLTCG